MRMMKKNPFLSIYANFSKFLRNRLRWVRAPW